MLMRDIDWWCLIEPCLYVNERYRLMMADWTMFVCLMRDIDWWCLIETSLHVSEGYRMMTSYETCLHVNERQTCFNKTSSIYISH